MRIIPHTGTPRGVRAKLIFNPAAGIVDESPFQLTEIIGLLQARQIIPEVHLVTPEVPVAPVLRSALRHGLRLVIVCGGDSTIESAAAAMIGSRAVLGIIPVGTRNNIARSLAYPSTYPPRWICCAPVDASQSMWGGHKVGALGAGFSRPVRSAWYRRSTPPPMTSSTATYLAWPNFWARW